MCAMAGAAMTPHVPTVDACRCCVAPPPVHFKLFGQAEPFKRRGRWSISASATWPTNQSAAKAHSWADQSLLRPRSLPGPSEFALLVTIIIIDLDIFQLLSNNCFKILFYFGCIIAEARRELQVHTRVPFSLVATTYLTLHKQDSKTIMAWLSAI